MGRPNRVQDGMRVPEAPGTHGKKREARLSRMVNKVFELREQGMSKRQIRDALHTGDGSIERILGDPNNIRRRLTNYNERLRAACPRAIDVVYETLNSTMPQMAGERASMAKWVLESTKTVGKESPINIFLKGGDTNIVMSNDTLEAAKAVAAAMRAVAAVKALPPATAMAMDAIDVTPIEEREENTNEVIPQAEGIIPQAEGLPRPEPDDQDNLKASPNPK